MPKVSLTEFADFLLKTAGPRQTQVIKMKHKEPYSPALDYWKQLRDGIIKHHTKGEKDKSQLDILADRAHANKKANYAAAVKGYQKFLGKKDVTWADPLRGDWIYKELTVSVNPELGLELDGAWHLIKMYFKGDKLTQSKVDAVLQLMHQTLGEEGGNGTKFSVLDVTGSKLFSHNPKKKDLKALLESEGDGFLSLWDKV